MNLVKKLLNFLTCKSKSLEIHEHQMIVCSAWYNIKASCHECLCKCCRILDNLLLICLELRCKSLLEAYCLTGYHMHERTALDSREYSLVEIKLLIYLVAAHDHTTTRSAESLVRCGCCHMSIWDWAHVKSCCHKSGDVCHIYHEICSNLISDLSESLEINSSGICWSSCYDKLWLALLCDLENSVIIYKSVIVYTVWHAVEILSRHVDRWTVGEMSAVIKIHSHKCIARIKYCEEYCHVCLCSWVWLYIHILTAKQLLGSLSRKVLNNIHILTSTVISLTRISLCILVGEMAAHGCHNRLWYDILGSYELQIVILSVELVCHCCRYFWIYLCYLVKTEHRIYLHQKFVPIILIYITVFQQ